MDFKVILVDDDAVILFLHKALVERSSLPAVDSTFVNGKDALDFLCSEMEKTPTPYLILLDINMPVLNGWQFLEELQERDFKEYIRVVMVTSSINTSDLEMAEKFPQVMDYLEKPISKDICDRLNQKMKNFTDKREK